MAKMEMAEKMEMAQVQIMKAVVNSNGGSTENEKQKS